MKNKDKAVVDGNTPNTYMVSEDPLQVVTITPMSDPFIPAFTDAEATEIVTRLDVMHEGRFHVGTYPRPH